MDMYDQHKQDRHEQAAASGMPNYVGIDVSKATLDVAVRPSGEAWQSANDEAGSAALLVRFLSTTCLGRNSSGRRCSSSGVLSRPTLITP